MYLDATTNYILLALMPGERNSNYLRANSHDTVEHFHSLVYGFFALRGEKTIHKKEDKVPLWGVVERALIERRAIELIRRGAIGEIHHVHSEAGWQAALGAVLLEIICVGARIGAAQTL
jgi:hypothetical protein